MKRIVAICIFAIMGSGLFYAYPFYTLWRIDAALANNDAATLNAFIDWESVRRGLKEVFLSDTAIKTLAQNNSSDPFEKLGGALGVALGANLVERLIESFANDKMVLAAYNKKNSGGAADIEWIHDCHFITLSRFHFSLQNPTSSSQPTSFIMSLQGLDWRITRVVYDLKNEVASLNANSKADSSTAYSKPAMDSLRALIDGNTANQHTQLGARPPTNKSAPLSKPEIDALQKHLTKLWNVSANVPQPEELVVDIRVRLTPDRRLASPPEIVSRGSSDRYRAAADAAMRAVLQGQPYSMLKSESYEQWRDMIVTFDPRRKS